MKRNFLTMMSSEIPGFFRSLSLLALLIFSAGTGQSQQANPPKPQGETAATQTDAEKRQASFELVWQTVDKNFYDPNFNGVNWKGVHDRYAPLVASAKTDEALYLLLQQMINELHQSHFLIVPPQAIPKLGSTDADSPDVSETDSDIDAAKPLDRIRRRLSERLSTGIGIDIRILDGLAVITRVDPGSPAARTGLRPGFVIKSVNGKPLSEAIAQIEQNPIFNSIIRPEVPLILVASYINGNLRDPVQLTYVNGRNLQRSVRIIRQKLNGEMSPAIGNLPPLFTEFEAKRLAGGIGYIRFNAFVPMLMKKVCVAVREMHDAPALIIDLRGNQGGLLGMIGGLAGLLEQSPANLGSMKTRTGYNSVFAFPQRVPYTGPLAILIDGSTLSAGEIFAAGLQETFRAVIVGDVSAGNTLPSGIVKLPTGALFQYAFGNYQTPNGIFLEGRGVIPDRIVKLNRRTLLVGGDPQLTAAVRKLRERTTLRLPGELVVDVLADTNANNPGPDKSKSSVEPPPPPKPTSKNPPTKAGGNPTVSEGTKEGTPAEIPANRRPDAGAQSDANAPNNPKAPSVDQIINHYIEAVGGESNLLKTTSRISSGTIELNSMGLRGTVDIYERAPNRSSVIMNLKGFGIIQQTFNGSARWLHDPVQGYIKLPEEMPGARDDFHVELELKRLAGSLRFNGKQKVGERDCFVIERPLSGTAMKYYFDAENGLLLRENDAFYEDYRDVNGVKLPFVVRQESPLANIVIRLNEVKVNVPIDEARFAERDDCFTKPEQYMRPNR